MTHLNAPMRRLFLGLAVLAFAIPATAQTATSPPGSVIGQVVLAPHLAQNLSPGARVSVHVSGCGERMILHPGQSFFLARKNQPCTLESWATLSDTTLKTPEGRETWTTRTIGLSDPIKVQPEAGQTTSVLLTIQPYDDSPIHKAIRALIGDLERPRPGESTVRLAGAAVNAEDVIRHLTQAGAQLEFVRVELAEELITIDYDPSRGDRIRYTYAIPKQASAS
jgi:hypothetical protein